MKSLSRKEVFYEEFAKDFDVRMNKYDLATRLKIVFEQLLSYDIFGLKLLDVGCGTGHFSKLAAERGAHVISMDVGPQLLKKVGEKCQSTCVVGSILDMPFQENSFDVIVCSEVIEHTPDPFKAVEKLYRVLKPGGTLALTVPNRFWKWSCILANLFRLRPYRGFENWVGYSALKTKVVSTGFCIKKYFGFHLFPFQLAPLHGILKKMDCYGEKWGPFYINIATSLVK